MNGNIINISPKMSKKELHDNIESEYHKLQVLDSNENYTEVAKLRGQNLVLEGNNIHALALLHQLYKESIGLIYVDPPYNTKENKFEYKDSFIDSGLSRKDDPMGHENWKKFMLPRLLIAKELLSEKGVIFLSIDENELCQCKLLCDSIYGEKNRISIVKVRMRNPKRQCGADAIFQKTFEYLLIYAKKKKLASTVLKRMSIPVKYEEYKYKITVNTNEKRIVIGTKEITVYKESEYEIKNCDDLDDHNILKKQSIRGTLKSSNTSGRFFEENLRKLYDEYGPKTLFKVDDIGADGLGYRYFQQCDSKGKNGTYFQGIPRKYRKDLRSANVPVAWDDFIDVSENNIATSKMIKKMLSRSFRGCKPMELMNYILQLVEDEMTVLDLFSGSASLIQKILEDNFKNNKNRRFIACQDSENDICGKFTIPRIDNGLDTLGFKERNYIHLKLTEIDQNSCY